jgi:fructose-1,6-bisphosphatase/inositol monophosphatase family enzyme
MHDDEILGALWRCAAAVREVLDGISDWRRPGDRPDQYGLDIVADEAAVSTLIDAGFGVLSEESGWHHADRDLCVIVDPVDGSTNASRGIPWFATSLGVIDTDGLRAGVVVNQASGVRYHATRGGGAFRDGVPIRVSGVTNTAEALVAMNGYSPERFGWAQYRAFGAAALDLCLLAEGAVDGYLDCTGSNHGVWDYAAAHIIVEEAGGVISDAEGRGLLTREHSDRRAPVAGASTSLHAELAAIRRGFVVA